MFGDNIRKRRKELHMTQSDLADKIGVSQNTVSMYERSERSPEIDKLPLICEVLETPSDYLLDIPVYYDFDSDKEEDLISSRRSITLNEKKILELLKSSKEFNSEFFNIEAFSNIIRHVLVLEPQERNLLLKLISGISDKTNLKL
ncbi:helix-turn-helix domain-containing protein [Eubacteriales bacterium KG127]